MLAHEGPQKALTSTESRFDVALDVATGGIRKMAVKRRWLWESGFSGQSNNLANGRELPVLADLGQGAAPHSSYNEETHSFLRGFIMQSSAEARSAPAS